MKRNAKFAAGAGIAALVLASGGGIAVATGAVGDDDGPETPITGDALTQASAVVLAEYPGAEVTDTEVGDEEGYYEVEVTLPDGSQVDVHLTEDFQLLGREIEDPNEVDDEDDA